MVLVLSVTLLSASTAAQTGVIERYTPSGGDDSTSFQQDWELEGSSIETVDGAPAVVLGESSSLYIKGVTDRADSINVELAGQGSLVMDIAAVGEDENKPLMVLTNTLDQPGEITREFNFSTVSGLKRHNFQFRPGDSDETLAIREVEFVGELAGNEGGAGSDKSTSSESSESPGFISSIIAFLESLFTGIL